jgi:glutamine cyclotransferase
MRTLAISEVVAGAAVALSLFWCVPALSAATLSPRVVDVHPHDPGAFTEGLLFHDGSLFESTGLYGESSLRRVDRTTGEVLQSSTLPMAEFGEGLALVDDRLIQLTYRNGLAHAHELSSFSPLGTFAYEGEGWGLCYDGRRLIMSDGSDRLTFRDPDTFEVVGSVAVQEDGVAYARLNELECVGKEVFANVWLTDLILRIDPETGAVLTKIDASGLLSSGEAAGVDVLNGIAYDSVSGRFLLTGKFWPKLFEVELDLSGGSANGGSADGGSADGGSADGSSCSLRPLPANPVWRAPWAGTLWALACRRWTRRSAVRQPSASSRTSTSLRPRTAA